MDSQEYSCRLDFCHHGPCCPVFDPPQERRVIFPNSTWWSSLSGKLVYHNLKNPSTLLGILPKNALWSPLIWAIIWSLSGFKEQKLPQKKINKGKRLWDFSLAGTYRKSLSCFCFGILCQCIQVRICYHNFFASKPRSVAATNSIAGTVGWMGGCSMDTSWTWAGIMPVCNVSSFL